MMICKKCGNQTDENVKFCPVCGDCNVITDTAQTLPQQTQETKADNDFSAKVANLNNTADSTSEFSKSDIDENKVMAVLAYILFFIPLLAAKESPFARFHTNQGIVLLIASLIVGTIGGIIPFLGWFLILPIGSIGITVLAVIGIVNAVNGKAKELPLIGKYKILK